MSEIRLTPKGTLLVGDDVLIAPTHIIAVTPDWRGEGTVVLLSSGDEAAIDDVPAADFIRALDELDLI